VDVLWEQQRGEGEIGPTTSHTGTRLGGKTRGREAVQQRRGRALFLIKAGPIALLASYWLKVARIRLLQYRKEKEPHRYTATAATDGGLFFSFPFLYGAYVHRRHLARSLGLDGS
jgi:hypothetical protein